MTKTTTPKTDLSTIARNKSHLLLRQICPSIAEAPGAKKRAAEILKTILSDRRLKAKQTQNDEWLVYNQHGIVVARTGW